jgi:chemotaxis protein MotB
MQIVKLSAIVFVCASALFITGGCTTQIEELQRLNARQQDRINQLQSELDAANLKLGQLQLQLDTAKGIGSADLETLKKQVEALQKDIKEKEALIASLTDRLRTGTIALPVELSTLLEDLAKANPGLITYDSKKGMVKFNSDLLFDKGSDTVASSAASAVNSLCSILNTEQAKNFDIIIAGHTDDIPIQKSETLAKHPTNWHLSVHRAISVEAIMEKAGITPKRLSVRGFGEYRPIEENAAGKKGNEKNRRVEIYIVQQGV